MLDWLIQNGMIIDGTGGAGYIADIGLKDGKIAAIGRLEQQSVHTLDAAGMTVTPGFLDIHRHGDLAMFRPNFGELELRQGLTTVINGNCGMSAAPFGPVYRGEILEYLSPVIGPAEQVPSESMTAYLNAVRAQPLPLHVGTLVGGGVLRADLTGHRSSDLTDAQYRALHAAMERALADGALGVSLGLGYAPECFYSTDGLIRALAPLAGGSVPVTVHMRDEGTNVDRSVEEMLRVARALHCPVHISHLKAIGLQNFGRKIPKVLEMLQRAQQDGLDVTWDVYPYTAGSTQLLHVLPPEILAGGTEETCARLTDAASREKIKQRLKTGDDFNNISQLVGWDRILVSTVTLPEHACFVGMPIADAAAQCGVSPEDFTFTLLAKERCAVTMIDHITAEEDVSLILQSSGASVISDSTYPTEGLPHPRLYGNFVRVIEKYVLGDRVLTLPQAVHKMTQQPAQVMRLNNKGLLTVGADADLNVFVPERLHERGTYLQPAQLAEGIDTVFVAGLPAILHGKRTAYCGGSLLTV